MKKKLKGQISISRVFGDESYIQIEIIDKNSRAHFLEIRMDFEEFAKCLTGQSHIDMEFTPRGLYVVGKIKEQKELKFEIPESINFLHHKDYAEKHAQTFADDGWTASLYFGSQDSITKDIDTGIYYANANQYRYV